MKKGYVGRIVMMGKIDNITLLTWLEHSTLLELTRAPGVCEWMVGEMRS